MSYITFHDISYAQGLYNMDSDPSPIVEMKMTGFYYGSKQPYADTQAARNYANAKRLGKIPILYHFAGGADPIVEADYFVNVGASPLADGDIYELDYELTAEMNPPANPDAWCRAFADRVHARTGAYPLLYVNTSTFLANNKFPQTMAVCGLIIADYRYTPDQNVPCGHPYLIQQYTDTPIDTNALFVSLDTLKKYAYHVPNATPPPPPAPTPAPAPAPAPDPVPAPQPPAPTPQPDPAPEPQPTPTPDPVPSANGGTPAPEPDPAPGTLTPPPAPAVAWYTKVLQFLLGILQKLKIKRN